MRKLSKQQLLFHYAEIMHRRKKEANFRKKEITTIINAIENIVTNAAVYSRTDLKWDTIKEIINENLSKRKDKKELQIEGEKMAKDYEVLSKVTPSEITVDISSLDDNPKKNLPKVKRTGGVKRGRRSE